MSKKRKILYLILEKNFILDILKFFLHYSPNIIAILLQYYFILFYIHNYFATIWQLRGIKAPNIGLKYFFNSSFYQLTISKIFYFNKIKVGALGLQFAKEEEILYTWLLEKNFTLEDELFYTWYWDKKFTPIFRY